MKETYMSLLDVLPRWGKKDQKEVDRLLGSPPEQPKPEPVYKGVLIVPTGGFGRRLEKRYEWSTDDPASVDRVERMFHDMRAIGFAAFETIDTPSAYGGTREESYNTRSFNPQAKVIQMQAQFAGG